MEEQAIIDMASRHMSIHEVGKVNVIGFANDLLQSCGYVPDRGARHRHEIIADLVAANKRIIELEEVARSTIAAPAQEPAFAPCELCTDVPHFQCNEHKAEPVCEVGFVRTVHRWFKDVPGGTMLYAAPSIAAPVVPSNPHVGSSFDDFLKAEGVEKEVNEIVARKLSAAPVVPEGWQPIATAPTDGTEIIGWTEDAGRVICKWGKHNHVPLYGWIRRIELYGEEVDGFDPALWMPLAAAPKPDA